jgi:hypothetical protein
MNRLTTTGLALILLFNPIEQQNDTITFPAKIYSKILSFQEKRRIQEHHRDILRKCHRTFLYVLFGFFVCLALFLFTAHSVVGVMSLEQRHPNNPFEKK